MLRSWARRGLQRLPFGVLYEVFYQSGRALGVQGYTVAGDAGTFCGLLSDQTVIKHYLRHGGFSQPIARMFTDFFAARGGGTFYDLGANIGLVTVPVAQNADVHCVCFEPDPDNFALLQGNVLRNAPHGDTHLVNAAVAEQRGSMGFTRSAYNAGDHRLALDGLLRVETVRLDDYPAARLPLAVKIDCQGAEPAIIAGGQARLAMAELIVCEFWPWGMRRLNLSADPILAFAAARFSHGQVLQHDQVADAPRPIGDIIPLLQRIVDDGRVNAQADLVLTR